MRPSLGEIQPGPVSFARESRPAEQRAREAVRLIPLAITHHRGFVFQCGGEALPCSRTRSAISEHGAAKVSARSFVTFVILCTSIILTVLPTPAIAQNAIVPDLWATDLLMDSAVATPGQTWNWHIQNTDILQSAPAFPAKYSGTNSLNPTGQTKQTVSLDLYAGLRLWSGAEAHVDGLMWQGFGLSNTHGVESFPNGDAYKAGTKIPNLSFAQLFIQQTIGFGGDTEQIPDTPLTLASTKDISRLTLTLGRYTPLDIVDQNAYAADSHSQFMSWGLMANLAWDYGQDTIGFGPGFAAQFNQLNWTLSYVIFCMPPYNNFQNIGSGDTGDDQYLTWPARGRWGQFFHSWAMAGELERRYQINNHPGAIRPLVYLNSASVASYHAATALLIAEGPSANLTLATRYRYKYGFGLNWEQEVINNVGVFSRLGWNDGQVQAMQFSDANWVGSWGVSLQGDLWQRPGDSFGLGSVISLSLIHI